MAAGHQDVTALLRQWKQGDSQALETLAPMIVDALHRLAHRYMSRERAGHVLQTTALVNEAYLRLVGSDVGDWQSRAHFFAVTARVMRHTLVDYARQRASAKRGADRDRLEADGDQIVSSARADEVVALDDGLEALRKVNPRACQVVELRYFGGYNNKEAAEVLAISEATVERDWRYAKAWLYRELRPVQNGQS
jgi:RNA polymerase sigma factor (TIGR02999 family)